MKYSCSYGSKYPTATIASESRARKEGVVKMGPSQLVMMGSYCSRRGTTFFRSCCCQKQGLQYYVKRRGVTKLQQFRQFCRAGYSVWNRCGQDGPSRWGQHSWYISGLIGNHSSGRAPSSQSLVFILIVLQKVERRAQFRPRFVKSSKQVFNLSHKCILSCTITEVNLQVFKRILV